MLISELAQRTGVSVHALRHYEKLGLISPARTRGGYRDYPESMRREVTFIAMSRDIGFSLKDVAQWLPAYRSGRLTFAQLIEGMQERLATLDEQIRALQTQRQAVMDHIAWARAQQKKSQTKPPATKARRPWPTTPRTKETP